MHYCNPDLKKVHVIFFYRNFMAVSANYCHIGLGVNSLHCVKVLRKHNVRADLFGVLTADDIDLHLTDNPTCTHAAIQAPWIEVKDLYKLMNKHPSVHFIIRVHSQIAFLQVEPRAVAIVREIQEFQESTLNLSLSANSHRFCDFMTKSFTGKCLYLPNLYDVLGDDLSRWRSPRFKDVLRISSFGAIRLMKNHMTAAAAAMLISRALGIDLEFHISVNRHENGGSTVLQSIKNLFADLKWARLIQVPWEDWPAFRRTVASMDLCIQLSMSETFNITTADAAAAGVPSVVGEAIEWVPNDWQVPIDDPQTAAKTGLWLLNDQDAGRDGYNALTKFNNEAIRIWIHYLGSNPT
jgi:hypothetical protein